jgi:hypothetical protein
MTENSPRSSHVALKKKPGRLPRSGFITFYCRARRFAAMYSSTASREYGFSASFRPASSASGGCGFCALSITCLRSGGIASRAVK